MVDISPVRIKAFIVPNPILLLADQVIE